MKNRNLVAVLLATALSAPAMAAGDCAVGKVADLPVTMRGLSPMVRAKINGRDAVFMADSGAFYSLISPGSAAEFGLKLTAMPGFRVKGVGGEMQPSSTTVKSFTIAGVDIPKVEFMVGGSEVGSVGLLGQNLLALLDAEFDLGHGMIRIMKSAHCEKFNLAYWNPPGAAFSILQTERGATERPHIIATIEINGAKIRALFDTGASTSFLSLKAAARAGLKPDGPGVTKGGATHGIGRSYVDTWVGPAASVKIGDEEIRNTRIRFGGDLDEVDMLIGADFFLSHHLYWAKDLRKLYFTFNGGRVFDLKYLRPESDYADDDTKPASATTNPAVDGPTPTDAEGFSRRGQARASRGDRTGGLADLDRAVTLAPDNADIRRQRAALRAMLGQSDKAVDDLDHLLKAKPDDVEARMMRAGLRYLKDREKTADIRADLDAAAAAASKSSDLRLAVAGLYSDIEAYPEAIAQYDLWIAAHPDDAKRVSALNSRCWARALSGQQLDLALKDCNAALSKSAGSSYILDSRGLVRLRMGDNVRAIADYDAALKQDPDIAWSLQGRGIARLRLGQKAAGEADLAKAKSVDPKVPERAKRLGIVP